MFYIPNKFSPFFIISFAASAGAGVVATFCCCSLSLSLFFSLIHQIFMRYSIINRHSQHTLRTHTHTQIHSEFKLPNKYHIIISLYPRLQCYSSSSCSKTEKERKNNDDDDAEQPHKIIVIRPYAHTHTFEHSLITYIGN